MFSADSVKSLMGDDLGPQADTGRCSVARSFVGFLRFRACAREVGLRKATTTADGSCLWPARTLNSNGILGCSTLGCS